MNNRKVMVFIFVFCQILCLDSYISLAKLIEKLLCRSPLPYKVAGCTSATSLNQRLQYRRFPENNAKFLRTLFLREHLCISNFAMNI